MQSQLAAAGLEVTPGNFDAALWIGGGGDLRQWPGYEEGRWSVQDESAMHASALLAPMAGERILDLCAAPGGKTAHLAELSGGQAEITACDVSPQRLRRIEHTVERLQLPNVVTKLIDRTNPGLEDDSFDAVLVDVPCSNSGVLARRPEARWRFREVDLPELIQLQTRLLLTAASAVKPGGRIVYSTCSIEPDETTTLLEDVTRGIRGLSLVEDHLDLPGSPADGAFRALLVKDGS